MAKNVVLVCTEHPSVKENTDRMGSIANFTDVDKLMGMGFDCNLGYSPAIVCQENSPMYNRLKNNNWTDKETGKKYDTIKEVDLEK